jgi:hypothetical protein
MSEINITGIDRRAERADHARIDGFDHANQEKLTHPAVDKIKTLPKAWQDHFPTDWEAAPNWKPIIIRRGLGRTVLCAARTRIEVAWAAYIKGIPGNQGVLFPPLLNQDEELLEVLANGTKLSESIARAIFPEFKGVPYAR